MPQIARKSALFVTAAALLTACAGAATPERSPVDVILTEGVLTMVAGHFQTQTALVTPASATAPGNTSPSPAYTPLGAASPLPSLTATWAFSTATLGTPLTPSITGTFYTPTPDPASLAFGCNNLAFIRDVNVPAGTVLNPNQDFKKTWKVQNTGTCNWLYQYAIASAGGNPMGGKTTKLGKLVTVDDWNELSVSMTAPNAPGTYTGYWRLQDADGHPFGVTLAVSITVSNQEDPPEPPTDTPVPPTDTTVPSDTPEPSETSEE